MKEDVLSELRKNRHFLLNVKTNGTLILKVFIYRLFKKHLRGI